MVIMTGMDWILRSSTPVRSGHQSARTKALCNKTGARERYWLPRVNINKSPSLSFFICLHPSITSLPLLVSNLPPSASAYAFHNPIRSSSIPFPLSNHLFIADLFIPYSSSFGTVHPASARSSFAHTGRYHHSFTPFMNPPPAPHHHRDTWGRVGSLWSNLTPYWFH